MKALVVDRDVARFGAARLAGALRPGAGARVGPLHLEDLDEAPLPSPDWVRIRPRLAGICGSDLATVDGRSSRWFEPIVSFPFVPGHEVVALDDRDRRVVVEPVLGCVARGIDPPCAACTGGDLGNCGHLAHGHLDAGLQSGYCCDTGGGWSEQMLAHPSQLHEVPDDLDDRAAVLIEPTACAVHAALAARVEPDETVAVIGAGTLGVLTIAALSRWSPPRRLVVAAKHPHQRQLVRELGGLGPDGERAPAVVDPGEPLLRAVRRIVGGQVIDSPARLTHGADVTIDCVGTAESISAALAVTRPKGRVVLVGMPGHTSLDLTPLWQREIALVGAYAYGTERIDGESVRTFDAAAELVAATDLGRLVSATYPLDRHVDAIAHAAAAGARGATKVAFALHDPTHPAPARKAPRR